MAQVFALTYIYKDGDNATYLFTSYESAREMACLDLCGEEFYADDIQFYADDIRESVGKLFYAHITDDTSEYREVTINPVYYSGSEGECIV